MSTSVHPQTRVGHVHLKVADLDRAIAFYSGVLGFDLVQRYGTQAAFLSAGGYHHHIGLNTWESKGGTPAASRPHGPLPHGLPLPRPRGAGRRLLPRGRRPASPSTARPTTA